MGRHSAVFLFASELHVVLARRKNCRGGDKLARGCCCGGQDKGPQLVSKKKWHQFCPVHDLWPFVQSAEPGGALFPLMTYAKVLERVKLEALSSGGNGNYGTQSLRKGAAQSIAAAGGSLAEILAAGNWSSSAFKAYLSIHSLQGRALIESVVVSSDSEGE